MGRTRETSNSNPIEQLRATFLRYHASLRGRSEFTAADARLTRGRGAGCASGGGEVTGATTRSPWPELSLAKERISLDLRPGATAS